MLNLVPEYILENYKNNRFEGEMQAFTMFIDVSGFTSMTEKLMQRGSDGAEILSNILKDIFKSTVNHVYECGGFISTFAGDAFTAIFPIMTETCRSDQVHNILYCAKKILFRFKEKPFQNTKYGNFEFKVTIGISSGEVVWAIVGKKDKSFYFRGKAIDDSAKSENIANKNEIIIDSEFQQHTKEEHLVTEPVLNGDGYFRIKKFKEITLRHKRDKTGLSHLDFTKDVFSKKFFPEEVFKVKEHGEFRNVISVFISFDGLTENKDLDSFFTILIERINHYSGYIENLDFGDKGGVVACFFGAPVSFEDNTRRALAFIFTSRKQISEQPNLKEKIKYRIGITYGKVYAGIVGGEERCQYSMLGSKVNLAARFMMNAKWGDIWMGEDLHQILKNDFNFETLQGLKLKGFENEITAYRIIEEHEDESTDFYHGEMIDRNHEISWMMDFVTQLFKVKQAGVLYINGEIGIGKTRLVNELRKEFENKHEVNWFYCANEEILKQSLNPFKYFLTDLFKQSSENSIEQNKNEFNSVIDTLIKRLQSDLPAEQADNDDVIQVKNELERTRSILGALVDLHWENSLYEQLDSQLRFENTLFAFFNLVIAECMLQPVIIEIEDAQWLDKDSIELLNVIARNINDLPLAIIFSSRYLDDGSSFSLELDKETPQMDIELHYLSSEGTKKLAEQILDNKIDEDSVKFLKEKTNGNPYFIEQLVMDFKERDFWKRKNGILSISIESELIKDSEGYAVSLATEEIIPSSINSVLISRFDRLTTEIKHVVQTASVLGREFEVQILSNMLKSHKHLMEGIKTAEEEQIWTLIKEIKCIYKHALLRDVVYNMQMRARLRELHLLAANSFKEIYGDNLPLKILEQYSYHFGIGNNIVNENFKIIISKDQLTDNVYKDNAEKYLNQQKNLADEYEKGCRYDETIHKCELVISLSKLLNNTELEIDYSLKNGKILGNKGIWDKSGELFRKSLKKSEEIGDKERIANCNATLGEHECNKGNYKMATSYFEKALTIYKELKDQEGVSRIILDIGTVYHLLGDYKQAMTYFNKSLKIMEEIGHERGIIVVTANMGTIYYDKGDQEKSLKCYEKSLEIARKVGNKLYITQILINIGNIYLDKGDFEKASIHYADSSKISEELGFKEGISQVTFNIGNIYRNKGQFDKTIDCYDKSIKIGKELGMQYNLANYFIEKAKVLYTLKRYDEAKNLNDEGLKIAIELSAETFVFKGKLLTSKLEYTTGNKKQSLEKLKELQLITKDKSDIADLYYEVFILMKSDKDELLSKDELEKYRKESLKIYKEQYSKTPNFNFKKKIEELSSENNQPN